MKLSLNDWIAIRDRTKDELTRTPPGKPPNAKFSKYAFSWDYHYTYPPGSVRLHYEWKNGQVSGWRTRHWDEGPFAPTHVTMDDEYLAKVFDVRRL